MTIYYETRFIILEDDDKRHDQFRKSGKMCGRDRGPWPGTLKILLRSDTLDDAIAVARKYDAKGEYPPEIIVESWQ